MSCLTVAVVPVPQAQAVLAATILRHLHAVITTGQAWDPPSRPAACATATHPYLALPDNWVAGVKLTVGASPTRH